MRVGRCSAVSFAANQCKDADLEDVEVLSALESAELWPKAKRAYRRLGELAAGRENIGHLVIGEVGKLLGVVCD